MSKALSNTQILRAALMVLIGFLTSGVLGFIRYGVLAAQFGTSAALDAFYAAQQIPELIFVLVAGGALGSSFIPIYARHRERSEEEGWRLASAVMTLASAAAGLLGLLIVIFAPQIVYLVRPEDTPELQRLTASMMQIMMITPFIFSISGLVMGILQSHGMFFLPSIAASMNSIGIMIGALLIAPLLNPASGAAQVGNANVYGLAYGAILSAVLHLIVQLPGLWKIRARLRPLLNPRIPGVTEVLKLMGPRVLGQAVVRINFLVNVVLTSSMIAGSFTALNTAFVLMFFALGVVGQSVGSAVFPTLSTLYAEGDLNGFRNRLSVTMRGMLFLAFPVTVGFIILGEPIVSIFERGEWTQESTEATAWALAFYALGFVGFTLLEILTRAFYALADTWTPVKIGIGAIISNIILSLIFIQVIGEPGNLARGPFAGLALANSLTTLVEAAILWWLLRRRTEGINDSYILAGAWRSLLAALLMGAGIWVVNQMLPGEGLLVLAVGGIVGALLFFGISFTLKLEEARVIPTMLLRRLRRKG